MAVRDMIIFGILTTVKYGRKEYDLCIHVCTVFYFRHFFYVLVRELNA